MKKWAVGIITLWMIFLLGACGGGDVSHVKVPDWKPSEQFTDRDVEAVIETVKDYFVKEFDVCMLTKVRYMGDSFLKDFKEKDKTYSADEVMVLESSFDVVSSGKDGYLTPGVTFDHWKWILIKEEGKGWKVVDHGYVC